MEEILFVFIFVALIFVGAVILKSWLRSAPKKDFFGIVIKVFDGDTVLVQSGFAQTKVRLAGEDAPEHDQRNGLESQRFLMNLILGKRVFVKVIDTDGYGRTVGLVYFGKDYRRDASFEVISAGWAWAYWQYLHKLPFGYKKRYAAAHYSAKNAKIGLWRDSEVLEPWNYRRQNKSLLKRFFSWLARILFG